MDLTLFIFFLTKSESESHSVVSDSLWFFCEFSRPEYWSGQPFPSPGDLPNPRTEPRSPALEVDSLPSEPPGKLKVLSYNFKWYVIFLPHHPATLCHFFLSPYTVSWNVFLIQLESSQLNFQIVAQFCFPNHILLLLILVFTVYCII